MTKNFIYCRIETLLCSLETKMDPTSRSKDQDTTQENALEVLDWPLELLDLKNRTYNCLRTRFSYVGEVVKKTEKQLMSLGIRGFGSVCLSDLRQQLIKNNVRLGMKVTGWSPPSKSSLIVKKIIAKAALAKRVKTEPYRVTTKEVRTGVRIHRLR